MRPAATRAPWPLLVAGMFLSGGEGYRPAPPPEPPLRFEVDPADVARGLATLVE